MKYGNVFGDCIGLYWDVEEEGRGNVCKWVILVCGLVGCLFVVDILVIFSDWL